MNTRKLSLLSLFFILLCSQTVFSGDWEIIKSIDELKANVENTLETLIDKYGRDAKGADKYKLSTHFEGVVTAINSLKYSAGRGVKIDRVKSNKTIFLNELNKVSCLLKPACKKLRDKIKEDFNEYYDLAKTKYGF